MNTERLGNCGIIFYLKDLLGNVLHVTPSLTSISVKTTKLHAINYHLF